MAKIHEDLSRGQGKTKLIFRSGLCPGDLLMLTAAVRDLHICHPGKFLTDVRTEHDALWENNPYITPLDDKEAVIVDAEYDLVHTSNDGAHHFVHGYAVDLEIKLGVRIVPTALKGDIHISDEEKSWFSQVHDTFGYDGPFWIVNAGTKSDYTTKQWPFEWYQKVVSQTPDITWVQIGHDEHNHPPLEGNNVLNLMGRTDMRQLIRLFYHAGGVLTGVSFPMHLAAAVEMHPRYGRLSRPCVVLAGGREPTIWEAYTNHAFLHTCGMLPCCDLGGCWKSRIIPLYDYDGNGDNHDESLCQYPVRLPSGVWTPKCMEVIKPEDVIRKVKQYNLDFPTEMATMERHEKQRELEYPTDPDKRPLAKIEIVRDDAQEDMEEPGEPEEPEKPEDPKPVDEETKKEEESDA